MALLSTLISRPMTCWELCRRRSKACRVYVRAGCFFLYDRSCCYANLCVCFLSIEILILAENGVMGTLPSSIGNLKSLQYLDYSINFLNESFPEAIGNLTELVSLSTTFNQQTGTIPTEVGLLTKLETLQLGQNLYTGVLPTELGSLTALRKSAWRRIDKIVELRPYRVD
jgi:hypothetical protein